MQIVLNHVTRMRTPRICVAGIEPESLMHVRPTTPKTDLITRHLLRAEGGPFGPGALVDLGDVAPEGERPEVEDHRFATKQVRHIEDLTDEEYLAILDSVARGSIEAAFGSDLREIRATKFAMPAGCGERSLAVLSVEAARLRVEWGKLYLYLGAGNTEAKLQVTDVRFYDPDDFSLRPRLVAGVNQRLSRE
jgi:hypothetical protein